MNKSGFRITTFLVLVSFILEVILPSPSFASSLNTLPAPTQLIDLTPKFNPPSLRGLKFYPDNPLRFDFIIDEGDNKLTNPELKAQSSQFIKYFLASLTIPEQDLWVNLSPQEPERIVPAELGLTEMGVELLAQDYILKQLVGSLTYPESPQGRKFWDRVYQKATQLFGTSKIPINTFNRVWIVPDKAEVFEDKDRAILGDTHLKVMLEEDYLPLKENLNNPEAKRFKLKEEDVKEINNFSSQIMKAVILPELEKEVNEGKNFQELRQIYHALILATWFKQKLKTQITQMLKAEDTDKSAEPLLNKIYVDKKKTKGIDIDDPNSKEKIYQLYLKAYSEGLYNYIRKDTDPLSKKTIRRRYYSGGVDARDIVNIVKVGSSALTNITPEELGKLDPTPQTPLQEVTWEAKSVTESAEKASAGSPATVEDSASPLSKPLSEIKPDEKSQIKQLVIPDIHAQYDTFVALLKEAGFVDDDLNWIAGDRTLIQLGDVLDRGPEEEAEKVWDLLDKLQEQAKAAGGKVIRELGNHELLYLQKFYETNPYLALRNGLYMATAERWREKIKQAVEEGRVVAAYQIEDRIVVHAGVVPEIVNGRSIAELVKDFNEKLVTAVRANDFSDPIFYVSRSRRGQNEYSGIFWADFNEELAPRADELIPQIVGHTYAKGGNRIRTAGKDDNIINVDVGMYQGYGGGKDAWVVIEEKKESKIVDEEKEVSEVPVTEEDLKKAIERIRNEAQYILAALQDIHYDTVEITLILPEKKAVFENSKEFKEFLELEMSEISERLKKVMERKMGDKYYKVEERRDSEIKRVDSLINAIGIIKRTQEKLLKSAQIVKEIIKNWNGTYRQAFNRIYEHYVLGHAYHKLEEELTPQEVKEAEIKLWRDIDNGAKKAGIPYIDFMEMAEEVLRQDSSSPLVSRQTLFVEFDTFKEDKLSLRIFGIPVEITPLEAAVLRASVFGNVDRGNLQRIYWEDMESFLDLIKDKPKHILIEEFQAKVSVADDFSIGVYLEPSSEERLKETREAQAPYNRAFISLINKWDPAWKMRQSPTIGDAFEIQLKDKTGMRLSYKERDKVIIKVGKTYFKLLTEDINKGVFALIRVDRDSNKLGRPILFKVTDDTGWVDPLYSVFDGVKIGRNTDETKGLLNGVTVRLPSGKESEFISSVAIDETMSKKHVSILFYYNPRDKKWTVTIKDLGSLNGTFVSYSSSSPIITEPTAALPLGVEDPFVSSAVGEGRGITRREFLKKARLGAVGLSGYFLLPHGAKAIDGEVVQQEYFRNKTWEEKEKYLREVDSRVEIQRLLKRLKDPNEIIVLDALGELKGFVNIRRELDSQILSHIKQSITPYLIEMLNDRWIIHTLRADVIWALGDIRDPETVKNIVGFLEDERLVRLATADALKQFNPALIGNILRRLYGDKPKVVLPAARENRKEVKVIIVDEYSGEEAFHGKTIDSIVKKILGPETKVEVESWQWPRLASQFSSKLEEVRTVIYYLKKHKKEHPNTTTIVNISRKSFIAIDPKLINGLFNPRDVEELGRLGVIFVFAAGDDRQMRIPAYPLLDNTLVVTSVDPLTLKKNDIASFGIDVNFSAVSTATNGETSFSAPVVVAVLANLLSKNPLISEREAIKKLEAEAITLENEPLSKHGLVGKFIPPSLYAKSASSPLEREESTSSAVTKVTKEEGSPEYGGIDLNPASLNMKVNKEGAASPIMFNNLPFDLTNFQGFTFQLIKIEPVKDLASLIRG